MRRLRNMEEFSEVTGLSRPTVSKYFQDPASVRASTRARIEKALETYDFRPSFHAMNQNRRNPRTVGIIVPLLIDPFYAELVRRLEINCLAAGYTAIVLSSHGSPEEEARVINMMMALNIGGVILSPLGRSSQLARIRQLAAEVPLVLLDSSVEAEAPFIAADNAQGIGLITGHLAETGPPPCYLDMAEVNTTAAERRNAYVRTMEGLGLTPRVVPNPAIGWDHETQGRAIARRYFSRGGFTSGSLLCGNDRFAIGVLSAACEAGVKVGTGPGATLRVAGHDDHPFARLTCPGLTTVAQDYEGLAREAVDRMLLAMAEGRPGNGSQRLPSKLVLRQSA